MRARRVRRRLRLVLIAIIFLIIGAAWAAYGVMVLSLRECSDDAYGSGNRVVISAQVSGTVIAVLADDTQLGEGGSSIFSASFTC